MLLVLKSPRFLYRETVMAGLDGFDVASRLSFGLWDSLPDQPLAARPRRPASSPPASRWSSQAERMVADLRTRSKLREFLLQWLKVDQAPEIAKDPKRFPRFDEAIASRSADVARVVPRRRDRQRGRRFPPAPAVRTTST